MKLTAGYPAFVGTVNNGIRDPYSSNPVSLGYSYFPNPNTYRELYHPCNGCSPVTQMVNSNAAPGFSGGALFGFDPYSPSVSTMRWNLLGVITNEVHNGAIDGIAVGYFDYNYLFWHDNVNWDPAVNSITISSPIEGATYNTSSVPNLIASAGSQTSQLQWRSNIDGALGSGGMSQ